jgi:hypothetical protein
MIAAGLPFLARRQWFQCSLEERLDANDLLFPNRLDSKGACESSLASFPEVPGDRSHDAEGPGS